VQYVREQEALLGERPRAYPHPFNAIRKAAYNFGWDWGPDLASVGIWKAIGLDSWSTARIAAVRPLVDVREGVPTLTAHVDVEWAHGATPPTSLSLDVAGAHATVDLAPGQATATASFDVPDAELWWPRGYGAQALHRLDVELSTNGTALS